MKQRGRRKGYPSIGTCPHCGAAVYDIAGPGDLPKAYHSCDCRMRAIYQGHGQTIIVQPAPAGAAEPHTWPQWPYSPYTYGEGTGRPLPRLPEITCGADGASGILGMSNVA